MTQKTALPYPHLRLTGILILLGMLGLAAVILLITSRHVSALPEYTTRTGEACATCHVNPGGGGPRTLTGLLWAARGRPDQVPELPGLSLAPRVTDEVELYEVACGGCHGVQGEGLSARGLTGTGIRQRTIESFTRSGIPQLGMPGFEDRLSAEQLEKVVQYTRGLSSGEIQPVQESFELPPALFRCPDEAQDAGCGPVEAGPGGN